MDVLPVLVPVSCPDPVACFLYSSAESCSSDAICDVNNVCEGSTSDTEGTLQGGEGRGAISVGGCVTPGSDCTSLHFKFNPVVMMDIPARVFVKVHYFFTTFISMNILWLARCCTFAWTCAHFGSLSAGGSLFPGGCLPQSDSFLP